MFYLYLQTEFHSWSVPENLWFDSSQSGWILPIKALDVSTSHSLPLGNPSCETQDSHLLHLNSQCGSIISYLIAFSIIYYRCESLFQIRFDFVRTPEREFISSNPQLNFFNLPFHCDEYQIWYSGGFGIGFSVKYNTQIEIGYLYRKIDGMYIG